MGIFVNPDRNKFKGLTNIPTTILTASAHTLLVKSIIICNRTADIIRINLQNFCTQDIPLDIYTFNEFELDAFETKNLIKEIETELVLKFSKTPSIVDSLKCFSNGYSQVFDCEITYIQLNELPLY